MGANAHDKSEPLVKHLQCRRNRKKTSDVGRHGENDKRHGR